MNEQNYTSLELSKKLAEGGCKLYSRYFFKKIYKNGTKSSFELIDIEKIINSITYANKEINEDQFPSYDILNDICVKYAKEFFGEGKDSEHKLYMKIGDYKYDDTNWTTTNLHTINILIYLQEGKKHKAEEYIWENCLFNPKNI